MFGFTLKPFEARDITLSELREHERELYREMGLKAAAGELVFFESAGEAWTITKQGKHVASVGLCPASAGVATVWQLPSKDVVLHQFGYAKFFRWQLNRTLSENNFHRLQTLCLNDDLHERWMTFLGFEKEGVLRKFGSKKQDYAIWARLTDGC